MLFNKETERKGELPAFGFGFRISSFKEHRGQSSRAHYRKKRMLGLLSPHCPEAVQILVIPGGKVPAVSTSPA